MFVVIVEFSTHPQHADAFRQRVLQQARDSLELEPDCHVFDVCIDPEQDNRVLLYEVYTDEPAFEAHLASSHFADFDACVRPWITARKIHRYRRI